MTDKPLKRTRIEQLKYDLVKWSVFLAPPVGIYLMCYFFLRDYLWSFIGTVILTILGVVVIFIWYVKKENLIA